MNELIDLFDILYGILVNARHLRAHSHCTIFSDCDYDSSHCNKWVVRDSTEVFTLCDCNNITNSYLAQYKEEQIAIRKKRTM